MDAVPRSKISSSRRVPCSGSASFLSIDAPRRIPTTRRVPSGLVISPDDRYAFVTLEGVGSEPGTVEVIDLRGLVRVASVDVGQQAGGIDFWRTEAVK